MGLKILAIFCVAGAVAIFAYDYIYSSRVEMIDQKVESRSADEQINFRLQSVDKKLEIQRLKAKSNEDSEFIDNKLSESEKNYKIKMLKGIDERVDSRLQDVLDDLSSQNKEDSFQKLEEEIQDGVDELKELSDYNEAEKNAFIEELIRSAKEKGLRIKVDEDLNVYEY